MGRTDNIGNKPAVAGEKQTDVGKIISEYLDERGARHAMVGYPYVCVAAEFLATHPEARAKRQLRMALEYVEQQDVGKGNRGRKAIDRCIRTMIAQMYDSVTVKELVFAAADHACLVLGQAGIAT